MNSKEAPLSVWHAHDESAAVAMVSKINDALHVLCHYEVTNDHFLIALPKTADKMSEEEVKDWTSSCMRAVCANGAFTNAHETLGRSYADSLARAKLLLCVDRASTDVKAWMAVVAVIVPDVAFRSVFNVVADDVNEVTRGTFWMPIERETLKGFSDAKDALIVQTVLGKTFQDTHEHDVTFAKMFKCIYYMIIAGMATAFVSLLYGELSTTVHIMTNPR